MNDKIKISTESKLGNLVKDKRVGSIVSAIEQQYGVDVYFFNGKIHNRNYGTLSDEISKTKNKNLEREDALLILITFGGFAEVAFKIAKIFQKSYNEFIVFAPTFCKSAGTMITLGAKEILMDEINSELGPLDVQMYDRNNMATRKSGLQYKNVFDSMRSEIKETYKDLMIDLIGNSSLYNNSGIVQISAQDALEHALNMAVKLTIPVISQLNPIDIANEFRSMQNGFEYGKRLAEKSKIIDDAGIKHLIWGYHSHGFTIDKDEASTVFKKGKINLPCEELNLLISALSEFANPFARIPHIKSLSY